MDTYLREIRYTLRRLAKSPTTSLAAVVTIGLGIALTTGVYSILDGLLLSGVPLEDPERLVAIERVQRSRNFRTTRVPQRDFVHWRDQQQSFEGLAGYHSGTVNLSDEVLPERYNGAWISASFLDLLRVDPVMGRGFEPADEAVGADPVVLISHQVWQRRYGGAADVLGRPVRVNSQPATLVGVLPPDFRFPVSHDVWLPLVLETEEVQSGRGAALTVLGRLKDGAVLGQAAEEMATIARRLGREYPETDEDMGIRVRSYADAAVGDYVRDEDQPILLLMLAGAVFVLLIACVNVTHLLLGRASARSRELAIRGALGSGRLGTVAQVLAESSLLSAAGAVLGVLLATFGMRVFDASMAAVEESPYWVSYEVSGRVLLFAVALSLLSAVVAGLWPALRASRANLAEALHDSGGGSPGFRLGWLSRSLVVSELALSCALMVVAALALRSALEAQGFDLHFETADVLTARVSLIEESYPEESDQDRFYDEILRRVAVRPEVAAAALGTVVPVDSQLGADRIRFERPGETYESRWQMPAARSATVSPGYFEAFGVKLLAGRDFTVADRDGAPRVVIVNEDFARREWPGTSPIGQRVNLWMGSEKEAADPDAGWAEVVGLVPNMRFFGFDNQDDQHGIYLPLAQNPRRTVFVVARTRTDPVTFTPALRSTVLEVDPDMPLSFVRSMDQVVEATLFYHRLFGLIFGVFGGLALLLAAVGLYGVMFVGVVRRTREMGVRMALGAVPRDVVELVLKQGLAKTAVGLGLGLVLGWAMGRSMQALLFRVLPEDPVTLLGVPLVLFAVALLACFVPARRASRIDPIEALRAE